MPTFPRYNSTKQPTTQQPSVLAPTDNTGAVIAETGQKIGSQVQDITMKWSNTVDTIQKTTAQANFKTGMLDIQNRAANDPDYNNSDSYFKEIEKLRKDSLKGFSSKLAETEAAIEFGYEAKVGQIQIDNLYKKKMIDVGQMNSMRLIDAGVNNPTDSSLPSIKAELDKQVAAGIFDHKDAYKIFETSEQKLKFNTFLLDFRNDPVATEKKFGKDAYGMDIETAEKARSKLKELKTIQREQEGAVFSDMSLRVVTGEIDDEEIEQAIQANKNNPNEGITESHGKQLIAAHYRDVTQRIGVKQFEKHRKAIDFIFSDSAQDRIKGYEAILEAYSNGLNKDEAGFLQKIIDTKKDIVFSNKASSGKKLIEQLFGARTKNVEEETKFLLQYAKRIADGLQPEQAAQATALDVVQKDHPATVADPDLVAVFTPTKGLKNITKVKRESSSGGQK